MRRRVVAFALPLLLTAVACDESQSVAAPFTVQAANAPARRQPRG